VIDHDEPVNASNETQVASRSEKIKRNKSQAKEDLHLILQTVYGRRVMWRFLEHCKVFSSVFSIDAQVTAHGSGKQDVGHFILAEILGADELAFSKMMKESKENK
jgi:hypothetical protein